MVLLPEIGFVEDTVVLATLSLAVKGIRYRDLGSSTVNCGIHLCTM